MMLLGCWRVRTLRDLDCWYRKHYAIRMWVREAGKPASQIVAEYSGEAERHSGIKVNAIPG